MTQPTPEPEPADERAEAIAAAAVDLMDNNPELNSSDALELAEMIVDGKLA